MKDKFVVYIQCVFIHSNSLSNAEKVMLNAGNFVDYIYK